MSPTDFGFAKLISMHDESFFANFAVLNVQPRFTVVLPTGIMLKIAYIIRWDISRESGVLKKVANQIRSWLQQGHHAKLFALSPDIRIWNGIDDLPTETVLCQHKLWGGVAASRKLFQLVSHWEPDIVYLRSMVYFPSIENLLSSFPVVVEVNTKEVDETMRGNMLRGAYWYLTRSRILGRAKGIVAVTTEIAQDVRRYRRPIAVIANGILFSSYPFLKPANNVEPRLVFLGSNGMSWHGVDKIVELAAQLQHCRFDIIGQPQLESSLPNILSHGVLEKPDYLKIMAAADIALGTLALHRKSMEEACPLKVREYLACGIPTIIGYKDTDFPQPVPFILQLPNGPDNVRSNVEKIAGFISSWKGNRVARQDIAHLDNEYKEKQRLAFLEQLLDK